METSQARGVLDLRSVGGGGGGGEDLALIASLPKNSVTLASQAEEGGADAIMVNIEGEEASCPGHLGSYELHDVYIKDVISTLSIPCGIFVGGAKPLTAEYWESIVTGGFAFVDMYAHQMPLFVLNDLRVRKVVAVSAGYILEQVRSLSEFGGVEAVEVAIVPQQARGNPFTVLDFATLKLIAGLSASAVLLRTQKKLTTRDLPRVASLGVKGLVIDPSIPAGAEEAYRDEVASFSPRRGSPD
ncbi:MAG: hypothetical protein E6K96_08080 [Thaumarchaeota archaeon]|nr:MAG: hypothetical protein E6K96_08080 [Nitrososphaerota archaeon]